MNLRLLITSRLNTIRYQWHFRIILPETKQRNKNKVQTNKNMYRDYLRFDSNSFVSCSLLNNIFFFRLSYLSVDKLIQLHWVHVLSQFFLEASANTDDPRCAHTFHTDIHLRSVTSTLHKTVSKITSLLEVVDFKTRISVHEFKSCSYFPVYSEINWFAAQGYL